MLSAIDQWVASQKRLSEKEVSFSKGEARLQYYMKKGQVYDSHKTNQAFLEEYAGEKLHGKMTTILQEVLPVLDDMMLHVIDAMPDQASSGQRKSVDAFVAIMSSLLVSSSELVQKAQQYAVPNKPMVVVGNDHVLMAMVDKAAQLGIDDFVDRLVQEKSFGAPDPFSDATKVQLQDYLKDQIGQNQTLRVDDRQDGVGHDKGQKPKGRKEITIKLPWWVPKITVRR